jgi:hypothetical protein
MFKCGPLKIIVRSARPPTLFLSLMRGAEGSAQPEHPKDPSPGNVQAGLQVQEKSLRELRRYLFSRLFQLQVRRGGECRRSVAFPPRLSC